MAEEQESEVTRNDREAPQNAVLFELENIGLGGRRISFDVLKSSLGKAGSRLPDAMFSRFCLDRPLRESVRDLGKAVGKKVADAASIAQIVAKIDAAFLQNKVSLGQGVLSLIGTCAAQNVAVGAISDLASSTMAKLGQQLGLADMNVSLVSCQEDGRGFPTSDAWARLAQAAGVRPSKCLAVTSSAAASKAAIAVNMKCVVIPDAFTGCQDFGGCDRVADVISDDLIKEVLAFLEPR